MGILDALFRPARRQEFSPWNPNAQEPFESLDRELFRLDKASANLEQVVASTDDASAKEAARLNIALNRSVREILNLLRRESRSSARWQLVNTLLAVAALLVSLVSLLGE